MKSHCKREVSYFTNTGDNQYWPDYKSKGCHGDSMQRAENSQMNSEQGTIDINRCALTNWFKSALIYYSDGSMKRPHVHCVHSFAS